MKKRNVVKVSLLAPLLLLAANFANMSSLFDIAKPYAGTYECKYVMLGDENILDDFEYIELELLPSNIYKIEFLNSNKIKGLYRGHYSYDEKDGTITIDENIFGQKVKKTFSAKDGVIDIDVQYGKTLLYVKFEMR